jgi:hypothetical protein
MANFIYKKAKEAFLNGDIDVNANQLKVLFLKNSEYTPNQNTDEYVSAVPANAIVARSEAITSISSENGILDADDLTITNYSGAAFDAFAMYQHHASDAQARLIFYIDTSSGLPFEGSNSVSSVTIFWSDESTKILSF